MTDDKPIDLARVRRALAQLDRLAEEHPELVDKDGDQMAFAKEWQMLLAEQEGDEVVKQLRSFRLDDALVERLDAAVRQLEKEMPGPQWNRTAALQFLLTEAMDARGIKAPLGKGKKRR